MSCCIVSSKTISCIVDAIIDYNSQQRLYNTRQVIVDVNDMRCKIGQALLAYNVKAYNFRYRIDPDKTEKPVFVYEKINFSHGDVVGCIDCYLYQVSELNDYTESLEYETLTNLKDAILQHIISSMGQEIGWGID